MLQLNPVYLLWNRRKTLTGSPDPTRANGTNKPCMVPECLSSRTSFSLEEEYLDTSDSLYKCKANEQTEFTA